MLLLGESLNVISTKIGAAFKERDPKPIQEEALDQKARGMDYIDILRIKIGKSLILKKCYMINPQ